MGFGYVRRVEGHVGAVEVDGRSKIDAEKVFLNGCVCAIVTFPPDARYRDVVLHHTPQQQQFMLPYSERNVLYA